MIAVEEGDWEMVSKFTDALVLSKRGNTNPRWKPLTYGELWEGIALFQQPSMSYLHCYK